MSDLTSRETSALRIGTVGLRWAATVACALLCAAPMVAVGADQPVPVPTPAWSERGEQMLLSAQEARAALDQLPADNPAAVTWTEGGKREGWFGPAWTDVDGNGCDTRNDILGRDLTDADYSRRSGLQNREQGAGSGVESCPNATVWSGELHDPYTGGLISFRRGKNTSADVQIDHIIPLNYLYAHGAWAWDERSRMLVANDPLNLVAVDGPTNTAKGNCGPATCPGVTDEGQWRTEMGSGWWPPNDDYRCTYARRFVSVAATYQLGLPDADRQALAATLDDCVAGGNGVVSRRILPGPLSQLSAGAAAAFGAVAVAAVATLTLVWGSVMKARHQRQRHTWWRTYGQQ